MKKIIGYILSIIGAVGLIRGIIGLIEYRRISLEAAKEGIYFGLLGTEHAIFFFSLLVLIIGILLLMKSKTRL